MLVDRIEILEPAFESIAQQHVAMVSVEAGHQIVTLHCSVTLPECAAPSARDAALIADAMRQVSRMPEHRTCIGSIRFKPDALPLQLQSA